MTRTTAAVVVAFCLGHSPETTSQSPTAGSPVTPGVADVDLRRLPRLTPAPAGTPGRDVPDLRTERSGTAVTGGDFTVVADARGFTTRDRRTNTVTGPIRFGDLWPDVAEPCAVAVEWPLQPAFDETAGRWLLAQTFQSLPDGTLPACVAVSRTADPTIGGWWLYSFALPQPWPRPRFEVTSRDYAFVDVQSNARLSLERAAMLAGRPVRPVLSP